MDPADIAELCQFVGYGPLDAPLVFLGIEEKGRHPDVHPEDIEVRVEHFEVPVMDVGDAHELLPAPNPFHAPPGARPVQQWTTAAYFALELLVPLGLADQALGSIGASIWVERTARLSSPSAIQSLVLTWARRYLTITRMRSGITNVS